LESKYEDPEIRLFFRLRPKPVDYSLRSRKITNIGKYPLKTRWGGGQKAVRDALRRKAKHYGVMDSPFVIAVNTIGTFGFSKDECIETLFGSIIESISAFTQTMKVTNKQDGFFGCPDSPRNTRVSGVICARVDPKNVHHVDITLYRNPWAVNPLPNNFWKLPFVEYSSGEVVRGNCKVTTGEILNLDEEWPGDFFPP
jgi:hypothetical protein